MAAISKDTAIVERLTGLLPSAFKETRTLALIRAGLDAAQAAEDEVAWLIDALDLDNATGYKLDFIGRIVREPRDGASDATYLRFIKARILRRRSRGEGWRIGKIARLMLGGTTVTRRKLAPRVIEVVVDVDASRTFAERTAVASACYDAATTDAMVQIVERVEDGYFGWDGDADSDGWTGTWAELC